MAGVELVYGAGYDWGVKKIPKKVPKKVGRCSGYSVELTDEICRLLYESDGDELPRGLRAICRDSKMPHVSTVCDWLNKHSDFAKRYARARELRKDALVDRMMYLSRIALENAYGEPGTGMAGARVQAIRLEIDSIKWILGKEYSHDYGDRIKQEVTGAGGGPIKQESEFRVDADAEEMIKRIANKREAISKTDGDAENDS